MHPKALRVALHAKPVIGLAVVELRKSRKHAIALAHQEGNDVTRWAGFVSQNNRGDDVQIGVARVVVVRRIQRVLRGLGVAIGEWRCVLALDR